MPNPLTNVFVFPPTIIVVHPKERRSKCSVQHLRETPGFEFHKFPADASRVPPDRYVRLGMEGACLSRDEIDKGLLLLDGTWRWAERMENDYQHIPVRSLPIAVTAYPRVSKTYDDPGGGLATIEALYIAYKILGRNTESLLSEYRWAEEFLDLNGKLLDSLGAD